MWTLDQTLDRISPHLDPALVPPIALRRLRETGRRLPAALTRRIYLESWLGVGAAARVDLIVKLDAGSRDLLAGLSPSAEDAATRRAWRSVTTFARAWGRTGGLLEDTVESLWLEFDLDPDARPDGGAAPLRV